MFVTGIQIYRSKALPLALGMLYAEIADIYRLPALELLMKSLKQAVEWPDISYNQLEVCFLENLIEDNDYTHFQVRFTTGKEARDKVMLHLSVFESQVVGLIFTFPGHTGRGAAGKVIASIKSVTYRLGGKPDDLQYEIEGFPEQGPAKFIREHTLSAFVWIDALGRYLHVRENPHELREIREGRRKL